MVAPDDKPSSEQFIDALVDAGEFDAAIDVLDALRARSPHASGVLRLQARLYMADAPAPDAWRDALQPWCDGALERLARAGGLADCVIGYRVLARLFPDARTVVDRAGYLSAAVSPLTNGNGDPARAAIDELVAHRAWIEAWEAMLALSRREPTDRELARRVETLRDVLFEPPETRPYGALTPEQASTALAAPFDVAAVAARIQVAVRAGDLRGALADATALTANASSSPRWVRFRDALERLVAWSTGAHANVNDEETTQRTGPIERADLWLRVGNLPQAREAIRAQMAQPVEAHVLAALSERVLDLDVVLDGTLPTPIPARPPSVGVGASFVTPPDEYGGGADEETRRREGPSMPPSGPPSIAPQRSDVTTPQFTPPPAPLVEPPPQGTEDTAPARVPVPVPTGPHTAATGDVKVGKRKIVRLS